MIRAAFALIFALAATACGAKQFDSLCTAVPQPEGCGEACDPSPGAGNSCDPGYFCSPDGSCDIQCTVGGTQCGNDHVCTNDGRCVPKDEAPPDMEPDGMCPAVTFTPMPTTPSIGLVLDQSGSMYDNNLGNVTRYQAMRDALVAPSTGVVSQLESKAYFGSLLYTCANNAIAISEVPRALNNASVVRNLIDSKLNTRGGNTPTPEAINRMVTAFQQNPPPANSPPLIVLATDGLPNSCSSGTGTEAQSVAAARAAYMAGIPVYVLAINVVSQHFRDLAKAGQGSQSVEPYEANDAAQLKAAFDEIIRGAVSCDLPLTSSLDPSKAMQGTVVINGTTLNYGTDWVLADKPGTCTNCVVRVVGAACNSLKTNPNPQVNATFPCGSVVIF